MCHGSYPDPQFGLRLEGDTMLPTRQGAWSKPPKAPGLPRPRKPDREAAIITLSELLANGSRNGCSAPVVKRRARLDRYPSLLAKRWVSSLALAITG